MGDILQWKSGLQILLGSVIAASLVMLATRLALHATRWSRWDRLEGVYQNWHGPRAIEVEAVHQGTPMRFMVPVAPRIPYSAAETVAIAVHPSTPGRIVPLDFANLWRNLLNPAAFLVAALVAWINLAPAAWGQDRTWSGGRWVPTPPGAPSPGSETNAVALRPSRTLQRYPLVVLALFTVFTVGATLTLVRDGPGMPTLTFLICLGATAVLAGIVVDSRTLRLITSDTGLTELTFFGAKRVAWSEIDSIRSRNLNEKAQQDYDRSDVTRFQKGASRPPTIRVDFIVDAQQREILSLHEAMDPPAAYRALRARLARHDRTESPRRNP
jgi:hypothetical protein